MKHAFEFAGAALIAMALLVSPPVLVGGLAEELGEPQDLSGQILNDEQRDEYAVRMELSPEQVERVTPILDSAAQARRDALVYYGVDFEANERPGIVSLIKLKFAIDDINRKAEELLDPHLSTAQMRTYRDIVAEREADMRARLLAMN